MRVAFGAVVVVVVLVIVVVVMVGNTSLSMLELSRESGISHAKTSQIGLLRSSDAHQDPVAADPGTPGGFVRESTRSALTPTVQYASSTATSLTIMQSRAHEMAEV